MKTKEEVKRCDVCKRDKSDTRFEGSEEKHICDVCLEKLRRRRFTGFYDEDGFPEEEEMEIRKEKNLDDNFNTGYTNALQEVEKMIDEIEFGYTDMQEKCSVCKKETKFWSYKDNPMICLKCTFKQKLTELK